MDTLKIFENKELRDNLFASMQGKYSDNIKSEELYNKILSFKGNKFSDDFLTLVYDTLKSWSMNKRGARLSDFEVFKKSILEHKDKFEFLNKYLLSDICNNDTIVQNLKILFCGLQLTKTKTRIVTTSKTLHFFLPDLVVPMDNKYTLWFFGLESNRDTGIYSESDLFIEKQKEFSRFSAAIDLSQYIDKCWNRNIPKIIDNLIIAIRKY